MLWLLTLPVRIVFGIVFTIVAVALTVAFLPLLLLFALPFLFLRGSFRLVLLPILLLVAAVWLVVKMMRPRPVILSASR